MKSIKKPVFFIVVAVILAFSALTVFGVHTQYGDITTTWIRGLNEIRWGIDIRGGVDVTFTSEDDYDATNEQMDAAKSIIETRMVSKNITDYEIYVDYSSDRIIVRFPWQSDDEDFDAEKAVKELGETAMLTFREGSPTSVSNYEDLPLVLTGADVDKASPYYNSERSEYGVSLQLKESGKAAFSDATGRLAGTSTPISIWLDDYCFSAPTVSSQIADGSATISGSFDADSCTDLANKINGGALPFKLVIDSFSTISPTQGEGARDAMAIAGIIAFLVVSLFMVINYRLPGAVSIFGLLGQAIGSLAVITGFFYFNDSFTLTLPGIAGIILSIGMGVDANVITGERIKEELNAGKTLDGAVQAGYKRAFTAIFDGNITLMIIAFILMGAFGTPDSIASVILTPIFFMFGPSTAGTVYSFGFTLMVGAILNFVFGVFASRLMTYSIVKFKAFRKPSLYGYKGGASND